MGLPKIGELGLSGRIGVRGEEGGMAGWWCGLVCTLGPTGTDVAVVVGRLGGEAWGVRTPVAQRLLSAMVMGLVLHCLGWRCQLPLEQKNGNITFGYAWPSPLLQTAYYKY